MNIEIAGTEYINTLQVRLLCGGYFKSFSGWSSVEFVPSYNKFYFVLDGECEVAIEGKTYIVRKNQMLMAPAGKKHFYKLTSKCKLEKYWCHFDATTGYTNMFDMFKTKYVVDIKEPEKLKQLFNDMLFNKEYDDNIVAKTAWQRAVLMQIIASYLKISNYEIEHKEFNKNIDFEPVVAYMQKNIDNDVSIETLSGMVHLHPNYFIRVFKQCFGTSPIRFFNNLRIEKAKQLLSSTEKPIEWISSSIGNNDIYSFSKFFKQNVGLSPSKYRQIYKI